MGAKLGASPPWLWHRILLSMRIEKAIKQRTPFRNEWHKAIVNLIYTHNWLVDSHQGFLKQFGITHQQYNVLRILRGQYPNPTTTSDIRDRMLDKMSDMSRMIERLKKKELVEHRICPDDKRRVDVLINEAGLALLRKIEALEEPGQQMLRNLSEAEAAQLNFLLDKLRGGEEEED
jgi:DNA-binding MarR family transcriptional regulator